MYSDNDAAEFFDRFSKEFDTLYDEQRNDFMRWVDKKFRSDMFIRFTRTFEAFGSLIKKTILDIGCGSGPYMLESLKRGAINVTGIDPASTMLALASHRLKTPEYEGKFELINSLFPCKGIKAHDYVIIMGVMDYVNNPYEFLIALKPLVKTSAAISFPSKHWFRAPIRKIRYRIRCCPLFFYDEKQIYELCMSVGFSSVEIYRIPGLGMDFHVIAKP